jgi:hypothetical protein
METKNTTSAGRQRAKGAATEPLDGGVRTYGCMHAPARRPKGCRFFHCSAPLSGAPACVACRERRREKKEEMGRGSPPWGAVTGHRRSSGRRRSPLQPPRARDRGREQVWGLGFSNRYRVGFDQPKTSLNRPIKSDGQEQAASASAGTDRPWASLAGRGPHQAGRQSSAQGGRARSGPWATKGHGPK